MHSRGCLPAQPNIEGAHIDVRHNRRMRRFCPRVWRCGTERLNRYGGDRERNPLQREPGVVNGERTFKATTAPPPSHAGPTLLVSRCTVRSASSLPVATMPAGDILLHTARQLNQGLNRHLLGKQGQIVGSGAADRSATLPSTRPRRRQRDHGMRSSRPRDPWSCNGRHNEPPVAKLYHWRCRSGGSPARLRPWPP